MPKTIFSEVISFFATCARCGRCVGIFDCVGAVWAMCGQFLRGYFTVWALCGRCVGDFAISPTLSATHHLRGKPSVVRGKKINMETMVLKGLMIKSSYNFPL